MRFFEFNFPKKPKTNRDPGKTYAGLDRFRKIPYGPFDNVARRSGVPDEKIQNYNIIPSTKVASSKTKSSQMIPSDNQQIQQCLDIFTKSAKSKGYQPLYTTIPTAGAIKHEPGVHTSNGVFVRLSFGSNAKNFSVWLSELPVEAKSVIVSTLNDAGYTFSADSMKTANPKIRVQSPNLPAKSIDLGLDQFWTIVNDIESLGSDFSKDSAGSSGNKNATNFKFYKQAAKNMFEFWNDGMSGALSRGGYGLFDFKDGLITIGFTKAAYEKKQRTDKWEYREHAVPGNAIKNACIERCEKIPRNKFGVLDKKGIKDAIVEMAELIRRNLVLVYSTFEERDVMDAKFKTTMPDGWDPLTGDVLERFKDSGIAVYNINDGQRMIESK